METYNFLNLVAAGQASEAKDKLTELLSAKAFEALDARKTELAKSIFNGVAEEPAENSQEETVTEE